MRRLENWRGFVQARSVNARWLMRSIVMLRGLVFGLFLLTLSCGEQVVVRETEARCGNGTVEAGEQCDDRNSENADACSNACEMARVVVTP